MKNIETRLARLEARIQPTWKPRIEFVSQNTDGAYVETASGRTVATKAELEALGADYLVVFVPPRMDV